MQDQVFYHIELDNAEREWKMKTLTVIIITLVSGAIAGTILGLINQIIVEPYIDKAVNIEVQNSIKRRRRRSS